MFHSNRHLLRQVRLPKKNIFASLNFSTALPPQITKKEQLNKITKETYAPRIEKDLVHIYDVIPKGPPVTRVPKTPIDYYISRYVSNAGGTMLVHAAVVLLISGYIQNRIFNEVRKSAFFYLVSSLTMKRYVWRM